MKLISNTKQFNGMFNSSEEVREAILAEVGRYHSVANTEAEVVEFFADFDVEDYDSLGGDTEQQFDVLGIEEGGWIPTYGVKIESHYVDSGSEDYIFTVSVYER